MIGRVIERKPRPSEITGRAIYCHITMEAYTDLLNSENSLSIYYLSNNGLALTVYQIMVAYPTATVFQSLAFDHLQTPLNPVNPVFPPFPGNSFLLTVTSHDSPCCANSIEMARYDQTNLADGPHL